MPINHLKVTVWPFDHGLLASTLKSIINNSFVQTMSATSVASFSCWPVLVHVVVILYQSSVPRGKASNTMSRYLIVLFHSVSSGAVVLSVHCILDASRFSIMDFDAIDNILCRRFRRFFCSTASFSCVEVVSLFVDWVIGVAVRSLYFLGQQR